MDYRKILSRSFHITFKNKILWIFGMLIVSGGGGASGNSGGGIGQTGQEMTNNSDLNDFMTQAGDFIQRHWEVLAIAGLAVFLLAIICLILSVIAKGGLFKGISLAEQNQPVKFWENFKYGLDKFWRILGIDVLFMLIIFGMIAVLLVLCIPFFLLMVIPIIGWVIAIIAFVVLAIAFVLAVVVLSLFINFVYSYAIIEDHKIKESFHLGWHLMRRNFGEVFVMGLIIFGISIAIAIASLIVILAVVLVLGIAIFGLYKAAGWVAVAVGVAVAIVIFMLLALLIKGIRNTYIYSAWILTWRELSGKTNKILIEKVPLKKTAKKTVKKPAKKATAKKTKKKTAKKSAT